MGRAKAAGARGVKVLKTLGLYLREQVTSGPLVKIDDPRFDPMWEACGALGLPVAIHISDPEAFFLPIDRFNERYEELHAHPDWSFHGKDYPSNAELIAARDRVIARHPKTTFIGLHVGHSAENLAAVSAALDRFPNFNVEIGARIGELGRQPRTSRRFFERYQDRVLFGTDAVPNGRETPQQIFGDDLYTIYFRFLETEDEYFDYAPAKVPPQGRWRIYGVGLPDGDSQEGLQRERAAPAEAVNADVRRIWVASPSHVAIHSPKDRRALYGRSALDHADQHHRDRQDQQDVDEAAQRVRTHHAQQPQHEQQHEDRPQHLNPPGALVEQSRCQIRIGESATFK